MAPPSISIRAVSEEVFRALPREVLRALDDGGTSLFVLWRAMGDEERRTYEPKLNREPNHDPIHLVAYAADDVPVGYSVGEAGRGATFEMMRSAVLSSHRGRGIYTALLKTMLAEALTRGYARIDSQHLAANNAVLIPKLKAGFILTGLEVNDTLGVMARLSYFAHPLQRKVVNYRIGVAKPDAEIREHLFKERPT